MRNTDAGADLTALANVLMTRLDVPDEARITRFGKIDTRQNNAGDGACGPVEAFPMNPR